MKRTGFKREAFARAPKSAPKRIREGCSFAVNQDVVPVPKSPRYADRHLLDMARGKPCLLRSPICNHNPETVVACHGAGLEHGKGLGFKVSDPLSCWGCASCNHYTDAYGGATAAEKRAVFEAGHARQVALWREIAASGVATPRDVASARAALAYLAALGLGS